MDAGAGAGAGDGAERRWAVVCREGEISERKAANSEGDMGNREEKEPGCLQSLGGTVVKEMTGCKGQCNPHVRVRGRTAQTGETGVNAGKGGGEGGRERTCYCELFEG